MAQVYSINHNMKQALAKANEGLDLTKGNPRYTIASLFILLLKGRALYTVLAILKKEEKVQEAVALAEKQHPNVIVMKFIVLKAASFYLTLESFASDKSTRSAKRKRILPA